MPHENGHKSSIAARLLEDSIRKEHNFMWCHDGER